MGLEVMETRVTQWLVSLKMTIDGFLIPIGQLSDPLPIKALSSLDFNMIFMTPCLPEVKLPYTLIDEDKKKILYRCIIYQG